jgi:tetratricopeptide (TPR) repeat protein
VGIFLVVGLFQQFGHQHTASNQVPVTPNESTPQPDLGTTPQTSPSLAPVEKVPVALVQLPSPKPLVASGPPAAMPMPTLDAKAYFNSGKAFYDKKLYEAAISVFSKAIQLDPNYAAAYKDRGNAYFQQGYSDKAIGDYNEAIRIDPNYAYAYNNRGSAYAAQGQFGKPMSDFDKAIRLDPNYAAAYDNRGNAYAEQGESDKAISDYNEVMRLDPNYYNHQVKFDYSIS